MRSATELKLWSRNNWARVEVVGEKYHEAAIRRLFPSGFGQGSTEFEGMAHLIPEPQNPHDPNAVSVRVSGEVIGYLSREDAARYAPVFTALVRDGHLPTTACRVWAYEYEDWQGTDRRGNDIYRRVLEARASLVLDEPHLCVPANMPPQSAHRLLPQGGALQVRGEEEHLDVLAPIVRNHGEAWIYVTLRPISIGSGKSIKTVVELLFDGEPIGQLTPAMSAHYTATIEHLGQAGLTTAARVLLKGNAIQVEAVLYAARGHELDAAWLSGPTSPPSQVAARAEPTPTSAPAGNEAPAAPVTIGESGPVTIPVKPTRIVFQAPPGWPPPPAGWEPFPGWQPDPTWPVPPDGWNFWAAG